MRVYVSSSSEVFGPQIMTYAEYRVFAVLARHAGVRGAQVVLYERPRGRGVSCSVTIDFESDDSARARASSVHAAGAIDRAAERVGERLRRRAS